MYIGHLRFRRRACAVSHFVEQVISIEWVNNFEHPFAFHLEAGDYVFLYTEDRSKKQEFTLIVRPYDAVALAVKAMSGTSGYLSRNWPSFRYSERKSCPHSFKERVSCKG